MSVKLLTEHHLEFLSLTDDCRGSSESTLGGFSAIVFYLPEKNEFENFSIQIFYALFITYL